METPLAVELIGLTKRYASVVAVSELDLTIARGEILGLLGPNGAGKSTVMRILVGLLTPSSGSVRVHGIDGVHDPLALRRLVGYLPESFAAYPEMRVSQYLRFVAGLKGLRGRAGRQEVGRVVDACSLLGVARRLCGTLSKGYRQRVGLAQAILGSPPLVVLDEPTAGLDPVQVVQARSAIRSLAPISTVVVSTHVLSEVEALCSRVAVIDRGRLVACETPLALRAALRREPVLRIEVRAPAATVRPIVSAVAGVKRVTVAERDGTATLTVECAADADPTEDIVRRLTAADMPPTSVSRQQATLEDAFLDAIGKASA